jgi:hypothetical protein
VKVGLNRNRDSSVASLLQNDKNRNVILSPSTVILNPSPPVTLSETKGLLFRLRVNFAKNFAAFGILFILFVPTQNLSGEDFKRALPGKVFSFPQDHFSHPEFKTEWWYYSGHLQSLGKDGKSFGYQERRMGVRSTLLTVLILLIYPSFSITQYLFLIASPAFGYSD